MMYRQCCQALLLVLAVSAPLLAQEREGRGLDYNLVRLDADAAAEVPNDLMRVTLVVEHDHRDAAALPGMVNADMAWALAQARKQPKVKAGSGEYTTQPEYAASRIVGWRASQELLLESEDFGAITALATELQQKLQVRSMAFAPTRATQLRVQNELTTAALKAFADKASLITEAMGAKRYEVVEISVGGTPQHYPSRARGGVEMMAMAADAGAPIAVEAGTAMLTVTVSGRIQLR